MAEPATPLGLRLVGPPETNKVMAAELSRLARRALGRLPPKPVRLGSATLVYPWDAELAWVAASYHRTSARVLWDLYASRAKRLDPLFAELRRAAAADRRGWRWRGARISIDARNVGHVAAGPRQVVGAVKNALLEGSAEAGADLEVDPKAPDITLWARGHDEALTLSVDLTGWPRHRRGYRTAAGEAPLREPLAAALIMLARWDPRREALLDPMAGAGTIAIEAALMARGAPLFREPPAAARLPAFADIAAAGAAPLFADTRPRVVARELDRRVAAIAAANAERAGVSIDVAAGDLRDLGPGGALSGDGAVVTNPPWGLRLRPPEIEGLYRELGRLGARLGWRVAFLAAEPGQIAAFGRRPRVHKPMRAGNVRLTFCLADPP